MIGVDTNVLVRLITADEPAQTEVARRALARAEAKGERIFVSLPVLCELVWTLAGRMYRFNRASIAAALSALLEGAALEIQQRDAVSAALQEFRAGSADFSDYLVGQLGAAAGCSNTLTLDSALNGTRGFELLRG